jgi:hypothetical protein
MVTSKDMTEIVYGSMEAWFADAMGARTSDTTFTMTAPATGQQFEITVKALGLTEHENEHDSEFKRGCRFCDWESTHNAVYWEGAELNAN